VRQRMIWRGGNRFAEKSCEINDQSGAAAGRAAPADTKRMASYDIRDFIAHAASRDAAGSETSGTPLESSPLAEQAAELPSRRSQSPLVIAGAVRLFEFVLIGSLGALIYRLCGESADFGPAEILGFVGVSGLTVVVLQAMNAYHLGVLRAFADTCLRVVTGWAVVALVAVALIALIEGAGTASGAWLRAWLLAGLAALLAGRLIVMAVIVWLTRTGRLERRTAIVGGGEAADVLLRALASQGDIGLRVCGLFDDRNDQRSPDVVAGFPKLGTVDDLVAFARRTKLDLVIFTLPISAETRILDMLRKLWVLPVDIRLSAHMSRLRLTPRSYSYIGSVPVLDIFDRPIADWDLVLKWLFDKAVGAVLLIALSPLLILTALAVKLDSPGPVLFRQKRYGFDNEVIEVFKFRSMFAEASDATASRLVTRSDPRVTRVGRFLRKTSIDELPQLFNVVFKGNLSLVGPRPHALEAKAKSRLYEQVVDGYFARHKVKPGITGLAQINGWRGETDTEEKIQKRVDYDLQYIENWSVLLDLMILIRTPLALLNTENAY
jgi:Undecaprenyl-phosphate glucose phosphotransferase